MPLVAGIDSSTQSCKIVVCDSASGDIVREAKATHPEGTEVDPEHWWAALTQVVTEVGGLADVSALAVGGQQHGMVCLDAAGEVIRPALLWHDTRSAPDADDLVAELGDGDRDLGAGRWAAATGSVPVASFTVTKLRWLARHEPENAARLRAVALPHDWLTWRLAGSYNILDLVTDRSEASGTGYASATATSYRRDLLGLALQCTPERADAIVLPRIAGPAEGVTTGDPHRGWDHLVLGPGCGDNAGAALGLGLTLGEASLSVGTSGVVALVSATPSADPTGLVAGFADATGHYLPLAATLNGAPVLDAFARLLQVDHAGLDDLALAASPGAGGLTLVPYLSGERTPNLPDATGSLLGLTLAGLTRENAARAAVEGLLTLLAGAAAEVSRRAGGIQGVRLVGGAARSRAVRALAADALGVPVDVPPPAEWVAIGAARQAAWVLAGTSEPPSWRSAG